MSADAGHTTSYGYTAHLRDVPFDEARARITDALKQEGFGILTEIDVKATLKKKIDQEFDRYVILGACNPHLAHRALLAEHEIGLLLPCNVCVWEDDGGSTVAIARPDVMFGMVRNPALEPVMRDADQRLRRALEAAAHQ
jgi:uncharacterized protein (DUF302 family)